MEQTLIDHLLTVMIVLPLIGSVLVLLIPQQDRAQKALNAKQLALWVAMGVLLLAVWLLALFDSQNPAMQLEQKVLWIESLNIYYHVGVDGLSVLFIALTALLTPLCILVSWRSVKRNVPMFMAAFLALEAAVIGVFAALDFVLFYLFWEAMLIPMFLIIGVWGGENRIYAALKFFLYTFIGSVLMLVAMIYMYLANGYSFDIQSMAQLPVSFETAKLLWLALFIAFAVKVPMWPFHTWLPDAHVQAPTAGSVMLAGILLKMGAYGFLRFSLPIFPEASAYFTPMMIILSVIAIVYAGLVALAQTDMKKMIAYSSVSHMGFVTLGIFAATPESTQGAVMQMINHGIVSGALFMLIGVIYERTHTRNIGDYGGVALKMPVYAALFLLFSMAAIGLPGTGSFVGEFLILLGSYEAHRTAVVIASLGIVLGAVYMLRLFWQVCLGQITSERVSRLRDMTWREKNMFIPLVLLVVLLGFIPGLVTDTTKASVTEIVTTYQQQRGDHR